MGGFANFNRPDFHIRLQTAEPGTINDGEDIDGDLSLCGRFGQLLITAEPRPTMIIGDLAASCLGIWWATMDTT